MSRLDRIGERDGWICWLCEQPIDPEAPSRSPAAPTVDHVVPRSRGGASTPDNLRLAHRRCNAARGNHLPELEWPAELMIVDAAPLWQSLARLGRRGGSELVALCPTAELACEAGDWAQRRAERFLGGDWSVDVSDAGGAGWSVHLAVDPTTLDLDPGRPGSPRRSR